MVCIVRRSIAMGAVAILVSSPPVGAQAAQGDREAQETAASDSAPVKKKGLFGKMKDAAGSKVAKTVAKTVACTMVPGGQVIAGAIDASEAENAGEAAAGAAVGAAGGGTCMPGLAGMAGDPTAGAADAAGLPGAAGLAGAMPMGYGAGLPTTGAGGSPEGLAECMGLNDGEFADLTNPTRGEARAMTKKEMKRQQKLSKKVDMQRYQSCVMQAAMSPLPEAEEEE